MWSLFIMYLKFYLFTEHRTDVAYSLCCTIHRHSAASGLRHTAIASVSYSEMQLHPVGQNHMQN